ncbi:alpha/beta hydrolase family protein [Jatrophihabitans sp. DSM 45814]
MILKTTAQTTRLIIATPVGQAWVDLDSADGPLLLVIGHGAGGTVESPDLLAVRSHALAAGISVARVTQPYRVAGKKAPPTAASLDGAWSAIIANLGRRKHLKGLEFVYGGRSSGARVACRTAADRSIRPPASRVVALAFPVHPPGKPEKSRLAELASVPVPTLVVQGLQDPFGMPGPHPDVTVVAVAGDHSLKKSAEEVGAAVAAWLTAPG